MFVRWNAYVIGADESQSQAFCPPLVTHRTSIGPRKRRAWRTRATWTTDYCPSSCGSVAFATLKCGIFSGNSRKLCQSSPCLLVAICSMSLSSIRINAAFAQQFRRGSSYNWLLAYFFFNLALTIYNKLVLNGNFPFPYTLTAIHALCGAIGSWICLERNVFSMPQLTARESIQIILFSVLYAINIITSNVSLYCLLFGWC